MNLKVFDLWRCLMFVASPQVLESKMVVSSPAISKPQPPPYGSHLITANSASSLERRKDAPPPLRPLPNPPAPAWPRTTPSSTGSSSQQIQQRISVPPSPTLQPNMPLFPPGLSERLDPPPAVAVRPFIPDRGSRPQSPRKGPPTMNSSSIYHMYLQQAAPKSQPLKPALKAGEWWTDAPVRYKPHCERSIETLGFHDSIDQYRNSFIWMIQIQMLFKLLECPHRSTNTHTQTHTQTGTNFIVAE